MELHQKQQDYLATDCDYVDSIEQEARDMALDVCYRSQDWIEVGSAHPSFIGSSPKLEPTQGRILLTTGGPACQVTCDLEDNWPSNPEIEWQDWGTPWTYAKIKADLDLDFDKANEALIWFINLFWWGEQLRLTLSSSPSGLDEGLTPSQIPPFNLFIVARTTIATLTEDNNKLQAQIAELTPAKEQLDSLWIVLAVVFTLGVLF